MYQIPVRATGSTPAPRYNPPRCTQWEKRPGQDGAAAAEGATPVIAQAPDRRVPQHSGETGLPPSARTGAEGARSARPSPGASKLSGKRTEGRPSCGFARPPLQAPPPGHQSTPPHAPAETGKPAGRDRVGPSL